MNADDTRASVSHPTCHEQVARMAMLASALAGRDIRVDQTVGGMPAWTDSTAIFVDGSACARTQLTELCVQSALLVAGSLDLEIVRQLKRRPDLARRYLAIEGHRALASLQGVLPPAALTLLDPMIAARADSPRSSLRVALGKDLIADLPRAFGTIRARELLAAVPHAGGAPSASQHVPRHQHEKKLEALADDANQDEGDSEDFASSPVGGGGGMGKLLQTLLQMVRRLKDSGSPGADAPTHGSRSGPRAGVHSLCSTAKTEAVTDAFGRGAGVLYPEWDVHRHCYRPDWCTVREIDPPSETHAAVAWLEGYGLRKPLSRLGMGLDRFRRQAQGDEIDIDAAIELQLDVIAGSAPSESVYVESQRQRRDLSVLILLDISGSVSQNSVSGPTVHQQQRGCASALATVLHEVGDRVALYAFSSQGRSAVHMVPVKRFDESLDSRVMSRLHSLIPGAYSRLGAAIRHGASLLIERGGTPRKLLVVLSDGLAYDHGYEPTHGAADARQALAEARRDGVGCLCLSIGAHTDAEVLRRVFGTAAHATIPNPAQIGQVIGPLFRSALRAAEVRRRAA